jgi:tRNA G18 (ribose-2'-O)-methylase SpoU
VPTKIKNHARIATVDIPPEPLFFNDCGQVEDYGIFATQNPVMRKLSIDELNRKSVDQFKEAEKFPVVVVLDNIRSMHNVGSVFRTADAFLLKAICLCGYTPQPPHRDIHKTALGATETVQWSYYASGAMAMEHLRQEGYTIFAVEQVENSISLHQFDSLNYEKLAVVFGNEVTGVGEELLKLCDGCLEIPQFGMKHSLNISVAAGIVFWEIVKPRI